MRRIYPEYTYGGGPRHSCWWDETEPLPDWPVARGKLRAEVAVIGAGYTGLNAALHLAEAGADVVVLDENYPGWGASGRNGGFCCLGGGKLQKPALDRRFGAGAGAEFEQAEHAAVAHVAALLDRFDIDADCHSRGETLLAHRPRHAEKMRRTAAQQGDTLQFLDRDALAAHGMNGPFLAALTTPVGFALNPRKYLLGLDRAARAAGARVFAHSRVETLERTRGGFRLALADGALTADRVILATNGYSSETLPGWLRGRYLPTQSNILVTRPMSREELDAQGWTSRQMCYDTRGLLHYFRLMPDNRFLFGKRGGLTSSPAAEARARRSARRDFEAMFPAWRHVDTPHGWSGLVCLARNLQPFVGPVPDLPGAFAGLAYHGNGVAMGSYSGALLADLLLGSNGRGPVPRAMRGPLARFPLGRARWALLPPIYAARALRDG